MPDSTKSALTLAPYLTLARDLATLLTPVPVRDEFRTELYRSLVERARLQAPEPVFIALPNDAETNGIPLRFVRWVASVPGDDRRWVWGAAAVGSAVSLAGLVTYVWHRHSNRAA